MSKTRVEAFSDGVMAILITVMVLELRLPDAPTPQALRGIAPDLAMYLLSFVNLGIYWNNHHHLLHAAERVGGGVLWANLHLLFWLSLIPFFTRWMVQSGAAQLVCAVYGADLLLAAAAYWMLVRALLAYQPAHSKLAEAIGSDFKGNVSVVLYVAAIGLTFVDRWIAIGLYVLVALIWLVPDRRIESRIAAAGD
jgi:uncharacterized membrane protein